MFNKKRKNEEAVRIIYWDKHIDGDSSLQEEYLLENGDAAVDCLKRLMQEHGPLTLSLDMGAIVAKTESCRSADALHQGLEDLTDMTRDFLLGKAVEMKAFAVVDNGAVKGVFPKRIQAEVKRLRLIQEGRETGVDIHPIFIGSYEDFI